LLQALMKGREFLHITVDLPTGHKKPAR
jgi:hypothetical protein